MKRFIVCLFVMIGSIATLKAESNFVPNWSDGPHIGLAAGGDMENDAFAYGWQVEYNANPWFSLDLTLTLHEDEVDPDILAGLGTPPGAGVDLDVAALGLTGKVNLWATDLGLIYAGAGIGYYLFDDDVDTVDEAIDNTGGSPLVDFDADIHKDLGYHFSLGTTVHINRKWDAFLDGRYTLLDSDVTYTLVRKNSANGALVDQRIDEELDYDHFLLRAGVSYRF